MPNKLDINAFMDGLQRRNPGEQEFHQAVRDVFETVIPFVNYNKKYLDARILERMTEPDKTVVFRVCWEDDDKNIRVNRGYRVQFNNSIGPYKGGLRFHPSVNLSILKFLGFEQTFKNSLTTLPIGAGKGGSDFNPKGKSDREVMRFCQSYMTQLYQHIGPDMDVPAGDIGVGAREISYLFGQHKRITHKFLSVLTGKGLEFGGSLVRTEATGYGNAYFATEMLQQHDIDIKDKRCLVSGAGNVAIYCVEKLLQLEAVVLTLSDSSGTLYAKDGISKEMLEDIKQYKFEARKSFSEFPKNKQYKFFENKKPWHIEADIALPCATQNEIEKSDMKAMVKNGIIALSEGANMPCTSDATKLLRESDILYAPGKAANAGGVAVSALEMSQNSQRLSWSAEELERKLREIMQNIHSQCVKNGGDGKQTDYVQGANIAGFIKIAEAMLAYGIV
ncbi:MAG: NADP-specific glutamate dehydrogenase [Gammaproteobacteria bacterium]|nr:NADP-specific glutamate dehydrogenase [Gammaproteobacteria bacterium]MBT8151009.1 NADP-specific glutamate dehydrogenase [Gammaproteobacteria bacterium]NND38677.1 NADP-specific glutamate dehydrogenase [Pseudomonadales bacterium]NNL11895.1 NADP-specific glutamate dehydrogenase [Pseudomonadales bacterium]